MLLFSGCSGLSQGRYFVPDKVNGSPVEVIPYTVSHIVSGPAVATRLSLPNAKVTVRVTEEDAARNSKTVFFGPALFPIIPMPWNWFRDARKRGTQVSVEFSVQGETITWAARESTILLPEGNEEKPTKVEIPRSGRAESLDGPLSVPGSNGSTVFLTFELNAKCDEFLFIMAPLESSMGETKIPPVRFKRAKSWLMWGAP